MGRKIALCALWVGFVGYTLWLAPLDQPDTLPLVIKLVTGQWGDLNAILVAIFSLMGVWPIIYACLMFADGKMQQKIRAWPSFFASNATGIIGLFIYLLLREPNQEFYGSKDKWLKLLDSRKTGVVLLLSTIGLLVYAWLVGDWGDFVQQWQTSHFVNAMSLDFCLMPLGFPLLLGDDMARRGLKDSRIFWAVTLVPLFGPLFYLCLRPLLPEASTEVETRLVSPLAI